MATTAAASFIGSITMKRSMPLRTSTWYDSAISSGLAVSHEMKRIPVDRKLSGVRGVRCFISRSRSHGSSRWKRTATPMCVLAPKSSAW